MKGFFLLLLYRKSKMKIKCFLWLNEMFLYFLTLKKSDRAIYWFYFFSFSLSYEGGGQKVLNEDRPQWESQCYSQTFPLLDRMVVSLSHQFTDITKFFFVLPVITSVSKWDIARCHPPTTTTCLLFCSVIFFFLFDDYFWRLLMLSKG